MRTLSCGLVGLLCSITLGEEIPGDTPPEGYHLVAEDDCGTESQTHVVTGTSWLYPPGMVEASLEHRTIVFDNRACVFWYLNPNPQASYKVDVVYVDQADRIQRLLANSHQVHDRMELPLVTPRRFVFDIPKAAYAQGEKLELQFTREAGANAIVSYVRIWSTDPTPLGAPSAEERAAYRPPPPPAPRKPKPLWELVDTVQRDWLLQDALVRQPVGDDDWEEPAAVVERCVAPAVQKHLTRGRAVAEDLELLGAELATLTEAQQTCNALIESDDFDSDKWRAVYLDVRQSVRRLVFSHPGLRDHDGLLFVRRHHPTFNHQCARRRSRFNPLGGEICVLDAVRADSQGKVTSLSEGHFGEGLFDRPDVSFDGKRIVVGFADANIKDLVEEPCETLNGQSSIGNGTFFQVWEMTLDGSAPPRKITRGTTRRQEAADPIYLPDDRIAFMSPAAGGMVMCGDWAWADCLFSVNADGADLRQVTRAKEGEWDPALMDDGSILFTRWEYVMRFWRPTQLVWSVRPDGTYPRVVSGYLTNERNYARCRQIPGTSKIVCVEAHHHNDGSGNILIVDLKHGRDTSDGEQQLLLGSADCPYPIDENYFLVSHDPQGTGAADNRSAGQTGIYLADIHGGAELVYRDAELSAMYPTLIRPRSRPPVIPPVRRVEGPEMGQVVVQDVHRGLPEAMQGKARYLRVVEAHERHIHTSPCNLWVGMGGFETKTVLGVVPVESDGSACFRMPSNKAVFFSVLDEDYRALHTMRMTTYLRAGESVGCVGCHEPMASTPAPSRAPLATRHEPSAIEPPPWGLAALGFPKHIQPILDRRCTSCHDGASGDRKSFDLRAGERAAEVFVPNQWTVYEEGYQTQFAYPSYWTLLDHVTYADMHDYLTPPGSWGSRVSPLITLLEAGHEGVELDQDEWRTLSAWIDCNVPYLDDYRKFAVDPEIRGQVGVDR